ncbi:acid-sensing ion channel 4-B-like [Xenia sp. Carnegie-2017]|uniref:acid-sensing ion channel 4-B-like n=1 Tax=Xenia sp. Carnegie-2017 TaxID=2897299 RepID=UPI001F03B7C1|nr:acid-sensing ion channel 4-B-like [Xenia sp. Carnegie-2017]
MTTQTVKPICDPNKKTTVDNEETYSYSRTNCMKKCLSDEIIRQCNCAGTQFFLDMKTCSAHNETEAPRLWQLIHICLARCIKRLESLARKNKLSCYCPLACRTTIYHPVLSSAVWPAEKYLSSLLEELFRVRHKVVDLFENISNVNQYFRKNFLRINIFFQELQEQETLQRRSYGIGSLLSDIGGQLGLWVGVSVVTLVDFSESLSMFIQAIYLRLKGKNRNGSIFMLSRAEHRSNNREHQLNRKKDCVLVSPQTSSDTMSPTVDSTDSITIYTSPYVGKHRKK